MKEAADVLHHAEIVVRLSQSLGDDLLVIGAAALASHHYVRLTRDLDLGGNVSVDHLRKLSESLTRMGYTVELREPDSEDPLGGVLDIHGDFGQIQVISFHERFPRVIKDALQEAPLCVAGESSLRIIPLPHLVVLKLYAGGLKSMIDVVEVLSRNEDVDLDAIEALCDKYRVQGFQRIREELETRGS